MKLSSFQKFSIVLFIIYLFMLVWTVIFKLQLSLDNMPDLQSVNLHPFGDSSFKKGKFNTPEVLGNLFIFFPFGVYLNLVPTKLSYVKQIFLMAGVSLTFEILQYIFSIGVSDVTDFLMNTGGGIAGILVYLVLVKIIKDRSDLDKYLTILAGMGTVSILILTFSVFKYAL
ncbi:VanZ family protein [Enterococcus sp. BWB1-3]|uniref:VanZ family protein n=1 Tax=unclassified Enterococcus TaxID=2608891 RepID=UPI001924B80A|nr:MULTISPECIES: VanZ family protein [unclassified Enterococcus]MBL1229007.1 VanZ family protein [Enterococcus sp. BWB1-3]MCB5952276.1 VanZ family protein [Enterococcus sp. BWT-B8]MCB5955495.1 VanZ family protein [Enterococcus sp. CWB-B31]